ncbi:unnamed protein product [Caenorhabditis bovis]|uniref:Uncharacterized protein n=1 Tax=Caenorhabditis bovis TaxID=2654633 RepID=A0A8S1F087_9PELO|nr:unnamed protein product [Caenorhabditis bovis]
MPVKISIYRAFGQFLKMIEKTSESDADAATDRAVAVVSDYQNGLSPLETRSCPVVARHAQLVAPRRTQSCHVSFYAGPERVELPSSPITSEQSRTMNAATLLMFNFWQNDGLDKNECSLFEKLDGVFSDYESKIDESVTTLMENVKRINEEHDFLAAFDEYFERTQATLADASSDDSEGPLTHCMKCMCFNCWRQTTSMTTWQSTDSNFPQLPVFVRSPVDSLKLYQRRSMSLDSLTSEDSSTRSCSSESVANEPFIGPLPKPNSILASSPLFVPRRNVLDSAQRKIELLCKKIEIQEKIIGEMMALRQVEEELDKC